MNPTKLSAQLALSFLLLAFIAYAPLTKADSVGTYGDTTVVTGPDANPAWQLLSSTSGMGYSGVYLTVTGALTPATLMQLSAKYVMTTGTFGNGAPRFSIIDTTNNSYNEAYVYFGTPLGGGSFSDPNNGNPSYADTGSYADLLSSDVRVYSNGFGGFGNGNTGQTWAQFVAAVGSTQIGYISIDLDGGFDPTGQAMDLASFNVNGTTYAPSGVPDSGTSLELLVMSGFGLLGVRKIVRACNSLVS